MARVTATMTAMADGNATETVVVMVDGDRSSNGQQRWQWAIAMAMVMELAMTTEMAMAIAMATATARVTMTKAGLPLHVPAMCSAMAGATPCLHPHGHKESAFIALHYGGDTAKSVSSLSRGRVPASSPWIVFCLLFTSTVQFTEQASVCPLHYSGAQEPCQPIDALPSPLLKESRQPIDNLPQLLLHFLLR
jgi:hypothetical protein